jgi:hypothetical protein
VIAKFIELIWSPDDETSQKSIYALGNACMLDSLSNIAEKQGAIDALLGCVERSLYLSKETLDKILEHNSAAKYWCKNNLSDKNIILDGFYDIGFAGNNLRKYKKFPKLEQLATIHPLKGRETIVIDFKTDFGLVAIALYCQQKLVNLTPIQQIQTLANIVCKIMGGIQLISDYYTVVCKPEIDAIRKSTHSGIVPLGDIKNGSFQLRALLFKTLCDRLSIAPCSLQRGQEGSAWNVTDLSRLVGFEKEKGSITIPPKNSPTSTKAAQKLTQIQDILNAAEEAKIMNDVKNTEIKQEMMDEPVIIDLMFEPGTFLTGKKAEEYKKKLYSNAV